MKKILFNNHWKFHLEEKDGLFSDFALAKYSDGSGGAARYLPHNNWKDVTLPHDWAVEMEKDLLSDTFAGARSNTNYHRFTTEKRTLSDKVCNIGWYRKEFDFDPAWRGKKIFLRFEGIYRDSILWVNGAYMDRHASGYTPFTVDITDHLVEGEINSVAVRVDSDQHEGWWYEGSGIYRNVYLFIGEPCYIKEDETFIRPETDGSVKTDFVAVNDSDKGFKGSAVLRIFDGAKELSSTELPVDLEPYSEAALSCDMKLSSFKLWSLEEPKLYSLSIELGKDCQSTRFGFRTAVFDKDKGFLLNGKPVKIWGACCHQDFGGVGIALSDNLHYHKIALLKEMGCNAYRSAHHAPAPEILDACDELGIMVMDETRLFGSSPEAKRQLTDLIKRDRNHPSIIIWSLGNEEFSVQNKPVSARLMASASRLAKALDPTRAVCYGGNNGPDFVGANSQSEVRGLNYIHNGKNGDWVDIYHAEHPDQPIIGTEEASFVLSRGAAKNDLSSLTLDSTGNVTMPWGETAKGWVKYFAKRDYLAGSFMWTGFDYRGEPNPFVTANVASSFGVIDLCGNPKPIFYYYKSWWTDEPVLKLSPHWNGKKGEKMTVSAFTNCESIKLYLNGRLIKEQVVERFDAPTFEIDFEPGELAVEGIKDGKYLWDRLRSSGAVSSVKATTLLKAENENDVTVIELEGLDKNKRPCLNASDYVSVEAINGEIIGVGNGDPACLDYEVKPEKEEIELIRAFQCEGKLYNLPERVPNRLNTRADWIEYKEPYPNMENDFRLVAKYSNTESQTVTKEYIASFTSPREYQYVEFERLEGKCTVYLNGKPLGDNFSPHHRVTANRVRPFRFYCKTKRGENVLKVVCEHDPMLHTPISGRVKLARTVEEPWQVRLHYGKATVFCKGKEVKLKTKKI
ncbi:MAG: glycoside hydrolase family 2 protein [Ruminococcaceae bacterium]|nr:glycoside hydrolase family 2 protein [Oscillospiraceae bacterium]